MENYQNPSQTEKVTWKDYLKSKEFWVLIATLIGGTLIFAILFFYVFLSIFTKHGESTTVPEVVNKNLKEAQQLLYQADLNYEVQDSQYQAHLPPLTVIAQEPLPYEKVKPGRKVYLIVNQTTPPMVKIPEIIDVNIQQAKYMLENWKLKIGKLIYQHGEAKDAVIGIQLQGKSLKPGDKVLEGSALDLIVSKGLGEEKVPIPDLVGLNINDAINLLYSKGLSVGGTKYEKNHNRYKEGEIFKQNPKYVENDSVPKGTSFDLWIVGEEKSTKE
jgi:beta-lactam-binding protein with PASTA domain